MPGIFLIKSIQGPTSLWLLVLAAAGTRVTGKVPNIGRNWPVDVGQQHVSSATLLVDRHTRKQALHQRHRFLESGEFSLFIRLFFKGACLPQRRKLLGSPQVMHALP
jgi:hypothetical protein